MRGLALCAAALAVAPLIGGAAAPRQYVINIDKMKFGPAPPGLRKGDTILWVNRDMFRHTATARDGSFNIDLAPGKSGKTVLKNSGSIAFYCVFHPGMTGALRVGS